ncbi:MAG: 4-hydroxy-3-methylbut-2-enyl diphosphate reductase [Defluviitaleaceae bacterium]|nr:4-hydroxy-3-methylbut-2-enyl diphosphate reductase [Defluviitaleaceae bacterium]
MEVIKISPRGYCHGVVTALNMVTKAITDESVPKPIHILGMVVHNTHLTKAFEEEGVITVDGIGKTRLELLDEINAGTVVFTAHGISPKVREKAEAKGLHYIDASCTDVLKTHGIMLDHLARGYEVVYIGKQGHPETEGCLGLAEKGIHLIEHMDDIANLELDHVDIIITNQTTLSSWDVSDIAEAIMAKYPTAEFIKEICNATLIRQEAVAAMAKEADLTIVVGDPKSNNSKRLVQISEEHAKTPGLRIGSLAELDLEKLKGINKVAVTSGASTPTIMTKEVISFLENYDPTDPNTHDTASKVNLDKILMKRQPSAAKCVIK